MTINNESSNVNNGKLIHVKVSESKYFSILNAHIDLFWATEGGVLLLWLSLQNSIKQNLKHNLKQLYWKRLDIHM